ncbi:hypothetical protein U27_00042 [Candidatus Vecturithrix granuli]|uniref:Outer membrane protein beta-barrel domain-containing protein n=1 Tax=Vecturithrix granuli TaxID=1499967 RepID=A0A081C6E6_VECG1|nr:hypothetical protein U27_00042 [Candidatus Vecturithrix granuli]
MNSDDYKHTNYEFENETTGEVAYSYQNGFADIPEDAVTFSIGAEYWYPVAKGFQIALGVEYNSENTYVEDKLVGSDDLERASNNTYEQHFSNTVLYAAGKYSFNTISPVKPYILARLGYSLNEWEFQRNTFGTDLDMGVKEHLRTLRIVSISEQVSA